LSPVDIIIRLDYKKLDRQKFKVIVKSAIVLIQNKSWRCYQLPFHLALARFVNLIEIHRVNPNIIRRTEGIMIYSIYTIYRFQVYKKSKTTEPHQVILYEFQVGSQRKYYLILFYKVKLIFIK
jgi:hypothetical protein